MLISLMTSREKPRERAGVPPNGSQAETASVEIRKPVRRRRVSPNERSWRGLRLANVT
jgi:hypothetical protein